MQSARRIKMWTPRTVALLIFAVLGFFLALIRLSTGLGAATNLNDTYPWGFWLVFDVMGGEALAAGGFIIAATVYLLNFKKYKSLLGPALLTAFIGYLLAVVAVFLDIGHPFRIWHPAVMWQTKSVMFIVAILVMCYLVILALECSPTLLARTGMRKTGELMQNLFFPLALVGTAVAVAHQSALGGIFLVMQPKISPLWYNSNLPLLFLVSAVAIGLSVLSLLAIINSRVFGHDLDKNVITGLARGSLTVLIFYMILKISQLGSGLDLALVFNGSLEGNMFLLEMGIGIILPIFMLSSAAILKSTNGILSVNILVIVGVLVNRFNVCIFSMHEYGASRGAAYFPSVTELLITLGIISTGLLMFKLAAIHLPVFAEELKTVEEKVPEGIEEVITVTPIEETV